MSFFFSSIMLSVNVQLLVICSQMYDIYFILRMKKMNNLVVCVVKHIIQSFLEQNMQDIENDNR